MLIITIAFLFGFGLEMIVYLCSFGILRMSAGGYHMKSHIICFISYLAISVVGIEIVSLVPAENYILYATILHMVSMILIYRFAPVQTPNRQIFSKERVRFRKRSILLGYAFIFITVLLGIFNFWELAMTITVAVFTESLTLLQFKKHKTMEVSS